MGDIDFEVISAAENSNKFQIKTRFGKEKSVADMITLGPMAQATLVLHDYYNYKITFSIIVRCLIIYPIYCSFF
jgi:hypothetical protein